MEHVATALKDRRERRVLLIDDDLDFRESVDDILKQHGYSCASAPDAREARARQADFGPDVALVDLRLGSEDGLSVISDLKRARPDILCVLISAHADIESATRAFQTGVSAYLRKPVSGDELLSTLSWCFDRVRLQRDEAAASAQLEQRNRRLADLAAADGLTGLYNRRRFMEILRRECLKARRSGADASLVMLDVDHLKAVNDRHGHASGDAMLRRVARALRNSARSTDVVGRYGGDEFVILMPWTDARRALAAAERIRLEVEAKVGREAARSKGAPVFSSISLGVGSAPAGEDVTPQELVKRADQALYAAKISGRNCSRAWRPSGEEVPIESGIDHQTVEDVQRQIEALADLHKDLFLRSIQSIACRRESCDPHRRGHSESVARYAVGIAEALGTGPEQVEVIRRAGLLHDIGKAGVPEAIVHKPGPLTPAERKLVEQHVRVGARMLDRLGFLGAEVAIIGHHHERWDGRGYPDGIAGHGIPFGARVLAVADVFDAMTSDRAWRKAHDRAAVMQMLRDESGRQFEPCVVDALARWLDDPTRNLETLDRRFSDLKGRTS